MSDERRSSRNSQLIQPKFASRSLLARLTTARFNRTLESILDGIDAKSVFDAGCGEGQVLLNIIRPRFDDLVAADLDYDRLDYAQQQKPDLRLVQCDIQHIPLPDNAVDLVLSLEVLEHVGNPQGSVAELARVTRRYALLSVPNEPLWRMGNMARGAFWSAWGNTPEHINHWSTWGFQRFISPYFRVVRRANPAAVWTMILAEKVHQA